MPLGEAVCLGDGDGAAVLVATGVAVAAGLAPAVGLAVAAGVAVPAGEGPGAVGVLAGGGDPAWEGDGVGLAEGEVPGGQRLQEAAQYPPSGAPAPNMKGSLHLPYLACSWQLYWLFGGESLQLATPVAAGVAAGAAAGIATAAGDGEATGVASGVGLGLPGGLKTAPF